MLRGDFGRVVVRVIRQAKHPQPGTTCCHHQSTHPQRLQRYQHIRQYHQNFFLITTKPLHRCYHGFPGHHQNLLKAHQRFSTPTYQQRRHLMILRILRAATKIRYIFLGAAGTAGVGAKLTYNKWRDKWLELQEQVPQLGWISQYYPNEFIDELQQNFNKGNEQMLEGLEAMKKLFFGVAGDVAETVQPPIVNASFFTSNEADDQEGKASSGAGDGDDSDILTSEEQKLRELLTRAQQELLEMQHKFQKELDKLEHENRELRKEILMDKSKGHTHHRKVKKTVIDMYSDVLDLLSEYDNNYDIQDHLPRVVVIGDQSAGKTSVLEMIARARIFPRGSGQMMTRCPIMVTLTEGPRHVASFKGTNQEYDLSKEHELKELRNEVEERMTAKLRRGQTITQEVLSMHVKGPGLPRMVLVDLPGIISTETSEMATNTKESIMNVSRHYMSNPNAIILCIQDGSIDAERSIVTDLASQMDPSGKRTIFVMTKVDLAERNKIDQNRIKKILGGRLFPMKAMGYYAVVTGTGNTNESIDHIKQYEEDFFRQSELFKSGILKTSQMTTQNLSFAVANCFWQMVRESIEQQYDTFKAKKFNLETEWKNNYPTLRELDRDELFDKARGEILDEVLSLSQTSPQDWEQILSKNLWESVKEHAIENIYLPAAQIGNPREFKTKVDILLKEWADRVLPHYAVKIGFDTLLTEFSDAMEQGIEIGGKKDAHKTLFEELKQTVFKECTQNHSWQTLAKESLRVIQRTALEDSNVPSKEQWDEAIKFMEESLQFESEKSENVLNKLIGPGWKERWMYWSSRSSDQSFNNEVKKELDRLLQSTQETHHPELAEDEITAVKRNLQTQNIEVSPNEIVRVWKSLYRSYFIERALQGVQECRKAYYHRDVAKTELECNDLILFWRFRRMLQSTSNSLRQQIINTEARRLENEVKEILDDIGQNQDLKKDLLNGRQVDLAEELKRVRHIQESLEQFVEALKREKST